MWLWAIAGLWLKCCHRALWSDPSLSCRFSLFRLCIKMCSNSVRQDSHLLSFSLTHSHTLCNPIKPKCNRNVKLNSVTCCEWHRDCIYSKYWDKQCFNNLYLSGEGFCWVCSRSEHIHTVPYTHTWELSHTTADSCPHTTAICRTAQMKQIQC